MVRIFEGSEVFFDRFLYVPLRFCSHDIDLGLRFA